MHVPRSPEEIGPEWLTQALREGGIASAPRVTSIATQSIGAGAGLFGQLARLVITYDGAAGDAPPALIAKLPCLNDGNRDIGNLFRFYEREISFYREIGAGNLRVPRSYYSAMDVAGDEYILLLEDFSSATPGDEVAGCSPEQAEAVVRSIAAFHASWWQSPKLDAMDWMPYVNAPVHQSAQQSYQQAWGPYVEHFGAMLSPKMLAVGERLQTHVIDLLNLMEPAPRTIIHGDLRLDNIFFDHPDGSPVAVIDWQISSRGRGIFDVAYFLSSAFEPDIRRAHEMRLLHLWHDIIIAAGAKDYSWDDAERDYRTAILYCNMYTVIGVGSMDASNERGLALQTAWVRRRSAAIEDLDAAELMPA